MARQKADQRLRIGHAFLAAWGEMMTQGWGERIGRYRCNLGNMQEKAGFDTMAEGGSLNIDDIDIINLVVDSHQEPIRSAIHHYFRRDGIFKHTRTIKQVAEYLGYSDVKRCRKDIESVELVVYGRLFPKIEELKEPEPPAAPAAEPVPDNKFPPKSWHRPLLKLKE